MVRARRSSTCDIIFRVEGSSEFDPTPRDFRKWICTKSDKVVMIDDNVRFLLPLVSLEMMMMMVAFWFGSREERFFVFFVTLVTASDICISFLLFIL